MQKIVFISFLLFSTFVHSQSRNSDSLRGSITPERSWWNLLHYDLFVKVHPELQTIEGKNTIRFAAISTGKVVQIDLQSPLILDSVVFLKQSLKIHKEGPNAYFAHLTEDIALNQEHEITCYYHGKPRKAVNAPWDGGIVWDKTNDGTDFIATACQGLGASVWWPCKDHMYDEPEQGMLIAVNTPANLMNVSNGRLMQNNLLEDGTRTTHWQVKNPINNYGVNMNISNYTHWDSIYKGENGDLNMDFFVLPENLAKSKIHFNDAFRTMEAFEHWFGPYPFYEDGYKLVEVPYLGMEHQSSVTYGNKYKKGYLGTDLSATGWGLKWDYIIIHESGHEWFANNITYKDAADMWIHEGFTSYSEALFVEYFYGKEAGFEYCRGLRRGISNDTPIIGNYDVNQEGSGDMYPKGANLLHTLRQIMDNDEDWRKMLRGMNETYYHQTVTTEEIEEYLSTSIGLDLQRVFDQYLRTIRIPELVLQIKKKNVSYHWENVVEGFAMPLDLTIDGKKQRVYPTEKVQTIKAKKIEVDPNYYIRVKRK